MFLGHFGVALAAKKAAPGASLAALVLAAQLADLLWPVFLLLGWEQVRIAPGNTRVSPLDFVSYPYSHSLVAQLFWASALGSIYFAVRRSGRSAIVVAVCVPTHWLLDYIAHRADMPVVPGGARYGLGLWHSLPLTLVVELGLLGAGILLYLHATQAKDHTGHFALWSFLLFLILAYFGSVFGPPPPSARALALTALGIWGTIPWADWIDHHRRAA